MAIGAAQQARYWKLRGEGKNIVRAAAGAGVSRATAQRWEKQRVNTSEGWTPVSEIKDVKGVKRVAAMIEAGLPGPIALDKLGERAKRGLEDFAYFRLVYFGHPSTPWQLDLVNRLMAAIASENREYIDVNCPPGTGKSTLMHDFVCWLICRDRTVRVLMGGSTAVNASKALNQVRRSLERVIPLRADPKNIARGIAVDAETTLAKDYGRFKPTDREIWTREAIVVMQHAGAGAIEEKDPTVSSFGAGTEFTGGRYNVCIWDDMVSPQKVSSPDYREELEDLWVKTCEPRTEPEGICLLVGQRLAPDDLHRFVLDMVQPPEDDDDVDQVDEEAEVVVDPGRANMKYQHVVYKAHYDDRCTGVHRKSDPPFPEGCVLDPYRVPWRDIASMRENTGANFNIVFQQEDAEPDKVLVQKHWVYGDSSHIGCIDLDRDVWEIPRGLSNAACIVVATCDPSPTMFWSIQLWVYDTGSKQRFLIDHVRQKMEAPRLLEFDPVKEGRYTGIMEEWQEQSERIGFPIQTWIIENNAAQRFMLQMAHFRNWRIARGVDVIPHSTQGPHKADPNFGVQTLSTQWRTGRVRLPWKGEGKIKSLRLVDEVTRYPNVRTDDCVMAEWFFEWNLPNLSIPVVDMGPADRPSWAEEMMV